MSELRLRRGAEQQAAEQTSITEASDRAALKTEVTQELEKMLKRLREGPRQGLSHAAKKVKDQLTDDPYNMELILELGLAYAQDQQWFQCANVLLRGWKRVGEFQSREVRCHFLMTLCQASMAQRKYRQAMAVMGDIEEPEDEDTFKRCEALKSHVYCCNGDMAAGLKAFHRAIEGQDFESACRIWAMCYPGLKKVGALEMTKSAVEAMTEDEGSKNRLKLIELIACMKDNCMEEVEQGSRRASFVMRVFFAALVFTVIVCACYLLHVLESKNAARLKLKI
uniref:Uncharacterized protein n=1 Tax=Pyrodinium bahamense TaxID=73915 RepID=A0A7S0FW96_9DINO